MNNARQYIAFCGEDQVARGSLLEVALEIAALTRQENKPAGAMPQILVFDARNSQPVDLDWRGSEEEIRQRYAEGDADQPRRRGRPKLGVVGKEVTLLPRHWDWLSRQPGGTSVALRKLVEKARKSDEPKDAVRAAQTATYNFMYAVGGDLSGFEEAMRALYNGDKRRFEFETELWPEDYRQHIKQLSSSAFS